MLYASQTYAENIINGTELFFSKDNIWRALNYAAYALDNILIKLYADFVS